MSQLATVVQEFVFVAFGGLLSEIENIVGYYIYIKIYQAKIGSDFCFEHVFQFEPENTWDTNTREHRNHCNRLYWESLADTHFSIQTKKI